MDPETEQARASRLSAPQPSAPQPRVPTPEELRDEARASYDHERRWWLARVFTDAPEPIRRQEWEEAVAYKPSRVAIDDLGDSTIANRLRDAAASADQCASIVDTAHRISTLPYEASLIGNKAFAEIKNPDERLRRNRETIRDNLRSLARLLRTTSAVIERLQKGEAGAQDEAEAILDRYRKHLDNVRQGPPAGRAIQQEPDRV